MEEHEYEYRVLVTAKVKAFSQDDADEMIDDNFGPGEECGVEIVKYRVESTDQVG